ncbi:MAG: Ig-like domain-containing protein [Candidatus Eiseniibacteriota bacterium]
MRRSRGFVARVALLGVWTALAALALNGCARRLPPSGGPRDVAPPLLLTSVPDSGAVRVPRDTPLRLVFNEPMDRASVVGTVLLGPRARLGTAKWEGNQTVAIELLEPLDSSLTYTVLLASGARDVRGNALDQSAVIHFTTADSFPPGSIEGRVEGRGLSPEGVYVWAYRDDRGRAPDSTALDMDALGQSRGGAFRLPGLAVPGTYRLYAFVDRNRNRSFEPGVDLLDRSDSLIALTPEAPQASDVRLLATDPEALARVEGTVVDSLVPGAGALRVEVRGVPGDSAIAADRIPIVTIDVQPGGAFAGNLRGGRWRLTAYRDQNDDRTPSGEDPRSRPVEIVVVPGGQAAGLVLVVQPIGSPP